jgi:hypothetical protein
MALVIVGLCSTATSAADPVTGETETPVFLLKSDRPDEVRKPIEDDPNVKRRLAFEAFLRGGNHIWEGKEVTKDDVDHYPEAVLILGQSRYCSGVLISRTAVATAGHCVCQGVSERIFLGLDRNSPGDRYMELDSTKTKSLFDCSQLEKDNAGQLSGSKDLAVLFTREKIPFIPRRIATEKEIASAASEPISNFLILVGYGATEDAKSKPKQVKRWIGVPIASADCSRRYEKEALDDSKVYGCAPGWEMVSAEPKQGPAGACDGDSGAPGYVNVPSPATAGQIAIAAIVSRLVGQSCGFGSLHILLSGQAMGWLRSVVPDLP